MSKYKVIKKTQTGRNGEDWDMVEFNSGWITCYNENDTSTRIYYPSHEIARIEKWEESTIPPNANG